MSLALKHKRYGPFGVEVDGSADSFLMVPQLPDLARVDAAIPGEGRRARSGRARSARGADSQQGSGAVREVAKCHCAATVQRPYPQPAYDTVTPSPCGATRGPWRRRVHRAACACWLGHAKGGARPTGARKDVADCKPTAARSTPEVFFGLAGSGARRKENYFGEYA